MRAAIGSFDIFDPTLPTLPVLEPGKLVMEVKFTEMLPQIVRDILPPHAAEFTAVSKYVLCYEKTRYMNGFEYWYETQERRYYECKRHDKKSVLESGVFDQYNISSILVALAAALALGILIFWYTEDFIQALFIQELLQ